LLQLYFIRHGQSINNVFYEDESQAEYFDNRVPDPDLTSIGLEQARIAGKFLSQPYSENGFDPQNRKGFGLTHLYCSLMIRAVKTGDAISQATGLPLVAWPDIHETGGVFDVEMEGDEPVFIGQPGHNRAYFESAFPNLHLPENLQGDGWWNQGIEARENYMLRAQSIVNQLIEKHGGTHHRVGLVLHGGIFARILTSLLDVQKEKYWFLMNNCAISRVDISDEGHVMLMYMNKVDHLPDHMVT
jgi:2,3-bisphosphoglycerate-dependent phosphoglycerate mutase